ncbi:MAG: APC family permease [Gemmatimonadota bacterium]
MPTAAGLARAIRLPHATALVVGTIIGASIFVQPSEVTGQVPSIPGVFAVWLISGALTLCGALVCAELASKFMRSGGLYVYLSEAFSPAVGFLWGWAMFWVVHSGVIAAVAVVFARYVGYFLPLGTTGIRLVAILVILALSAINCLGVRYGSRLQAWFTLGKLLAIALIVLLAFTLGARLPQHFQIAPGGPESAVPSSSRALAGSLTAAGSASAGDPRVTFPGFIQALVAGLFAFGGWYMVTYSSDETVDPRRTIPRALVWGTAIVTLAYLALNAAYLYILPLQTVATSTRVAADAADALLGFGGGAFLSGLVIFSTFGALSGIILAGPRVYWAMAHDGLAFGWLGRTHPRFRTPARALALQAAWASVLAATGTYRALFSRVIYTEWLFLASLGIGVLVLRRRQDDTAAGRSLSGPVVPILFAAVSVFIVINHMAAHLRDAAFGLTLVLLGLPVYFLRVRGRRACGAPRSP